jgi:hypothetical protein
MHLLLFVTPECFYQESKATEQVSGMDLCVKPNGIYSD